jgi:hypothetical protein
MPTNYQNDSCFPFTPDPISINVGGIPVGVPKTAGTSSHDPWYSGLVTTGGVQVKANAQLTGGGFKAQQPNRSGSARFTGMRVMLDQLYWDGGFADPVAPLATRVGTRVRNISGSGEWWWRPGAPIALVMDTITPALVYKLPSAITLGPGDTLDVEMRFPAVLLEQMEGDDISFQIGISFNGYAAIEG